MEKKRILFVSQEIKPFLPNTEMSMAARTIPQGVQDSGKEIRVFTPRYGVINERRHQLHEVIRLSGMNLIIDDIDRPLIIKVASIPTARMQVYFIDNDEYFRRKGLYGEENKGEYEDNDERSMFFCKGVLETVKKLGWKPDIIHCHGWMTALMPMYIKEIYKDDPHFSDVKVVYSLYDNEFNNNWDGRFTEKLKFEGFSDDTINTVKNGDYVSLNKAAMNNSDGIIIGSENINDELKEAFNEMNKHKLENETGEVQPKLISEFFDKIIEEALIQ